MSGLRWGHWLCSTGLSSSWEQVLAGPILRDDGGADHKWKHPRTPEVPLPSSSFAKASHMAKLKVTSGKQCPASSVGDTAKSRDRLWLKERERVGNINVICQRYHYYYPQFTNDGNECQRGKGASQGHTATVDLGFRAKPVSEVSVTLLMTLCSARAHPDWDSSSGPSPS